MWTEYSYLSYRFDVGAFASLILCFEITCFHWTDVLDLKSDLGWDPWGVLHLLQPRHFQHHYGRNQTQSGVADENGCPLVDLSEGSVVCVCVCVFGCGEKVETASPLLINAVWPTDFMWITATLWIGEVKVHNITSHIKFSCRRLTLPQPLILSAWDLVLHEPESSWVLVLEELGGLKSSFLDEPLAPVLTNMAPASVIDSSNKLLSAPWNLREIRFHSPQSLLDILVTLSFFLVFVELGEAAAPVLPTLSQVMCNGNKSKAVSST